MATASAQALPDSLGERERLDYLFAHAYAFYSSDFDRADSLFRWAVDVSERRDWPAEHVAALRYLGIVAYLSGEYDRALGLYQRSLSGAEALADPAAQAAVLVEMGNFFKKRKELERATGYLLRAEELAREAGDSVVLSNSLDIQSLVLRDRGQQDRAAALLAEVLSIRRRIGDSVGLSYVYDNLARLAIDEGRSRDALTHLDSSIALRHQLGDRQGEAIAVNNQGEALLVAGDTAAAIAYLERSLVISRAVGFADLQQWTMGLLAAAYASTGDPARALVVQQGVQTLKDSLYTSETTRQIAEMQERFEAERRQRLLEQREAVLQRRTAYLVAAALGVLLLTVAIAYIIRQQAERRRELRRQTAVRLRDDRLRISRDLHDHLGAELSIIASDLGRLDRQSVSAGALGPVAGQVRYAMEQMRETIWAVRLEEAHWDDLFHRLQTFTDRLDHEATITFYADPALEDEVLEPQRVLQLYRFVQEALRNALRHGGGSRVEVSATTTALEVYDNGCGFEAGAAGGGFGLASLRERASEAGGVFYLDTTPGGGSRVGIRWNT